LRAPQAIDVTGPGQFVLSQRDLGFASAHGEIAGYN